MADVDITSLSVEISAESSGAELNIDKLTAAISNLRTKGNVTKVVNSLDKLSTSISALKQASTGLSGLDNITNFLNGIGNANFSGSVKSINSVVNAIKKIPAAVSSLNSVDFYSMSSSITELTNALAPLSILDASGLKAIGSAVNAIGKIPDLSEKLKTADLDAFTVSCQKISTALTPLASQLDKVGNAFAKLPPQMSKVVTQTNRVVAANQKAGKSYLSLSSQMSGFMKRAAQLVSLKAIANYIGNAVVKFNDYYEVANLFGMSMKGLTSEASDFISKMETLLGIDPTEAMNNMATIQSLTTSFGMASDKAYVLSKNLTQLGYDLASLKNIPVAESFTKIQAAISGELEPIRRLGVDLSQARLQQELLALGFTQSVSSLSQADKAVLRYIAIMKQTTDAQGDFARTISSPANQIRVLQAQLESLARSVGSLLYPALSSILPPLIAAVELVKELVQWIAKLMGVKVEFPDFSGAASNVGDVSDALDDTTHSTKKAAKALKDYTMGFDELNIIDPTQGSSGSGSGSGTTGNILGDVDLSGYDMFKDYVGSSVDEIKAKLEKLAPLISGIAAGFATWAIGSALMDALSTIKKDGSLIKGILELWKSPIMGAAVAVGIMVARFVDLYQNSEAFRKGLERVQSLIYLAAEGFKQGWNISLTDGKLGESIEYLKETFTNLKEAIWNLIPDSWKETISSAFESFSQLVKDLDLDVGDLAVTLAGIGLLISGHPVAGLAVLGFEAMTVAVRGLGSESEKEAFDMETDWFNAFKTLGEKVADFVADAITAIANLINDFAIFIDWIQNGVDETDRLNVQMNGNFIENAVMGIAQLIHDIGVFVDWIVNGVDETDRLNVQMNGNFIENAVMGIAQLIHDIGVFVDWIINGRTETEKLDTAANGNFIEKFVGGLADVIHDLGKVVDAIGDVKRAFDTFNPFNVGKNIVTGLVKGMNEGSKSPVNTAKNIAGAIADEFKEDLDIHSPSKVFEQFGEFITQGLANGINAGIEIVREAVGSLTNVLLKKGQQYDDAGAENADKYVNGFFDSLQTGWKQIDSALQNDFIGSMQTLGNAIQKGDLQSLGKWAASYFWNAMNDEQRKQIKGIANNALSWLKNGLSSVWNNIASLASSYIGQLVPATATATGAQIGLNTAMDANPILLVISVIGMLVGALINFAGTNSEVADGISSVWKDTVNFILQLSESIMRVIGFIAEFAFFEINLLIDAFNVVGQLFGAHIDHLNNFWYKLADSVKNYREGSFNVSYSSVPGTSAYESSSSSSYTYTSQTGIGNSDSVREDVYNGCYNAFLDIWQRYAEQIKDGQKVTVVLDGKSITSSVEKQQADRGMTLMGNEVYSY